MTHHPMYDPPPSPLAQRLFHCMRRHGGSMRVRPLLRELRVEPREFIDAVIDLSERYWIRCEWRKPPPGTPDEGPRDYTEIDHLVITRYGRKKNRR